MGFLKYISLLFLSLIILTSCNSKSVTNNIILSGHIDNSDKNKVFIYETERLKQLYIELKNAEVTFTNWGKKEVRVEVETVIIDDNKDKTDKIDGTPNCQFEDDVLTLKEASNQKNKHITILNKIIINAPCEIKNYEVKIEKGTFSTTGDLISSAKININNGNVNISRFQGDIDAKVLTGNISINSGRFNGTSSLKSTSGNIISKAEIFAPGIYKFEVDTGNLDLKFPARLVGDFSCQGNVVANEFKGTTSATKVIASSKEGSISLKKY